MTHEWVCTFNDESFEHLGHLLGEIIREQSAVTATSDIDVLIIDTELIFDFSKQFIHEKNVVIAGGPGTLATFV